MEQVIIGACLLESGAFVKVADFLEPKNFSNSVYAEIYQVMCRLYPESPIDMITIKHHATNSRIVSYMAEATSIVSNAANLRAHALILMEYSIRDSAIATLSKYVDESFSSNLIEQASIREVIDEFLDYGNDIFELINNAKGFFSEKVVNVPLADAFQSMQQMVDARVHRMKQQVRVDTLLRNFMQLGNVHDDPKTRLAATHLCNVLLGIITSGKVSDELANKIFDL